MTPTPTQIEELKPCELKYNSSHRTIVCVCANCGAESLPRMAQPDAALARKAAMLDEAINFIKEARPIIRNINLFTDDQLGEFEYRRDKFLNRTAALPYTPPATSERDYIIQQIRYWASQVNMLQNDNIDREANIIRRDTAHELAGMILKSSPKKKECEECGGKGGWGDVDGDAFTCQCSIDYLAKA